MFRVHKLRMIGLAGLCFSLMAGCIPMPATPGVAGDPNQTSGNSTGTPATNSAPIADAGADQTVSAGDSVVLSASASSDADGDRLAFVWRQIAGDPAVDLRDGFSSRPKFFAPTFLNAQTTLTFRLTVADGIAAAFDEVSVTITP